MRKKYNEFNFCREDYTEYNDYLRKDVVDEDAMFEDIKALVRVALKNDYQMKIWDDGMTITVEYEARDPALSEVSLEWIGVDEEVVGCDGEPQ